MPLKSCRPLRRSSSYAHRRGALRRCLLALLIALTAHCGNDRLDCPAMARKGKPFTFRLINRSASTRLVSFGCGGNRPIELDTPRGTLSIGTEKADFCGNMCDLVLLGVKPSSCSDCGPGVGPTVAPGMSTEIVWDRRVWVPATIAPSCSGLAQEAPCALAVEVDAQMVVGRYTPCGSKLGCTFTADLSLDGVDVEFE